MTDQEALAVPLTSIELAELHEVCAAVLTPAGLMLLRRLAFQGDILRQRHEVARRDLTQVRLALGKAEIDRAILLEAARWVVKVMDYHVNNSPDPTAANYVPPFIVAVDRKVAEDKLRAAVKLCEEPSA